MTLYWPLETVSKMTFDDEWYDQIFDPIFHTELARLMQLPQDYQTMKVLRQGHYEAFLSYKNAKFEHDRFQQEKVENAKLDKVANDAERLMKSLVELFEFGQTQAKLAKNVIENPTCYLSADKVKLADLLDMDRLNNQFFTVREFLSDLSMSTKRSVNKKPRKSVAASTSGKELKVSKDRAGQHNAKKGSPLTNFVRVFRFHWSELSPLPFTEGHYYGPQTQHISPTIDAIALSFACHSNAVTRQNIVTSLRKSKAS